MKGYERESKEFYIEQCAKSMAHEIYLYKKYRSKSKESLSQLYNTSLDQLIMTDEEEQQLFLKAKEILENTYFLKIVNEKPIVLEEIKEVCS